MNSGWVFLHVIQPIPMIPLQGFWSWLWWFFQFPSHPEFHCELLYKPELGIPWNNNRSTKIQLASTILPCLEEPIWLQKLISVSFLLVKWDEIWIQDMNSSWCSTHSQSHKQKFGATFVAVGIPTGEHFHGARRSTWSIFDFWGLSLKSHGSQHDTCNKIQYDFGSCWICLSGWHSFSIGSGHSFRSHVRHFPTIVQISESLAAGEFNLLPPNIHLFVCSPAKKHGKHVSCGLPLGYESEFNLVPPKNRFLLLFTSKKTC